MLPMSISIGKLHCVTTTHTEEACWAIAHNSCFLQMNCSETMVRSDRHMPAHSNSTPAATSTSCYHVDAIIFVSIFFYINAATVNNPTSFQHELAPTKAATVSQSGIAWFLPI